MNSLIFRYVRYFKLNIAEKHPIFKLNTLLFRYGRYLMLNISGKCWIYKMNTPVFRYVRYSMLNITEKRPMFKTNNLSFQICQILNIEYFGKTSNIHIKKRIDSKNAQCSKSQNRIDSLSFVNKRSKHQSRDIPHVNLHLCAKVTCAQI